MNAELSAPTAPYPATRRFAVSDYVDGMERLLQAVQELSLAHSLQDIQRIVRSAARELTGCDGATFVLRDNDKCYYADEEAIAPSGRATDSPSRPASAGGRCSTALRR
jgi:GAF domain-containing protein